MSTQLPKVIVSHWVHAEVLACLREFCEPLSPSVPDEIWSSSALAERSHDASALIACMADRIDAEFLDHCPNLKVVAATLKGYDNFDAEACQARGVWLTVVPDIIIPPTAELTLGLAISLTRRISEGDRLVKSGRFGGWRPHLYGSTLSEMTVGIVGMGDLGRGIANLLAPFRSSVIYFDPSESVVEAARALGASRVELLDLFQRSGLIIITAPLTEQTISLIDRDLIQSARPGTFVVNVGRGSVVDEEAIADSLDAGRLAGYGADVFAMEDWALPNRPTHISERLLRSPNTLFTPHLGSAVDRIRLEMSLQSVHQVRQVLEGNTPDHGVNVPLAARS